MNPNGSWSPNRSIVMSMLIADTLYVRVGAVRQPPVDAAAAVGAIAENTEGTVTIHAAMTGTPASAIATATGLRRRWNAETAGRATTDSTTRLVRSTTGWAAAAFHKPWLTEAPRSKPTAWCAAWASPPATPTNECSGVMIAASGAN